VTPLNSYIEKLNVSVTTLESGARRQWLTPVILATQEAEIRRIVVPSQPGQIVHQTLSLKYPTQKGLVE
jgi:hypothetical protein